MVDILEVAAMEASLVGISEVAAMEDLMVDILEVAPMEASMVDILEVAAMEASMVDILLVTMEVSMEPIWGNLQTAEDQIVDQHSMGNLVIQEHPVGSTVGITLVIQIA